MNGTFKIINGPSKFDLMNAVFDRKGNGGKPHQVRFETDKGVTLTATILMVAAEDGSGESWIIEGFVTNQRSAKLKINLDYRFRGWFSTAGRGGHLNKIQEHRSSVLA